MNKFIMPIWMVVGIGAAFLFLKSQWWSVMAIQPAKPKRSRWLIIGGAIVRWLILAIVFITAGNFSIMALVIVFVSFMFSRLFILFFWQKSFNTNEKSVH